MGGGAAGLFPHTTPIIFLYFEFTRNNNKKKTKKNKTDNSEKKMSQSQAQVIIKESASVILFRASFFSSRILCGELKLTDFFNINKTKKTRK